MTSVPLEGYIKYYPTIIERALEERIACHKLSWTLNQKVPYDLSSNLLLARSIKNGINNYEMEYIKVLPDNHKILKSKPLRNGNNEIVKMALLAEALMQRITFEHIIFSSNSQEKIILQYEKANLFEIAYDGSEAWAEPLIQKAFLAYFKTEIKNKEPCRYREHIMGQIMQIKAPKTMLEKRKAYRQISIDILNMIVDEFAEYLK